MSTPLPASVSAIDGPNRLPLLHITNAHATVELFLDGAHLSGYGPAGHRDVLFLSRDTRFEPGVPLRGGIPICGPWFGAGPDGDREPVHGFFRNARWELVSATDEDDTTVVTLRLPHAALAGVPGGRSWPEDAVVEYTVRVGPALTAELTVTAGAQPLELEAALHTYLSVADVRRVQLTGLEGASYLDRLTDTEHTQDGPVVLTAETDRIYASTGTVVLDDPLLRRRITIAKAGSADTVVWNPWVAKAASLPDFADDEWPLMLCVEAANVQANRVELAPGASTSVSTTISAEHL